MRIARETFHLSNPPRGVPRGIVSKGDALNLTDAAEAYLDELGLLEPFPDAEAEVEKPKSRRR